jgi:hypothetical protein
LNRVGHAQRVRRDGQRGIDPAAGRHERTVDHKQIFQFVRAAVAIENASLRVRAESACADLVTQDPSIMSEFEKTSGQRLERGLA